MQGLLNKIQLWRLDRALAKIEDTERQIRAQKETNIATLERELQAMEEEKRMRAKVVGKTGKTENAAPEQTPPDTSSLPA